MSGKPHSADYFGDSRDFWWNHDFLKLMSVRWNLSSVATVLDVGCGVGHWSRCLAPFLPRGCALTGLDREPRWIGEAQRRSGEIANLTASFLQGEAERLPFADNAFDLVTCQTVLIHVNDPVAVIREMIRVLKPGGLLVIVEPNNLASNAADTDLHKPVGELIQRLEFQMICERGKMNLGEGFNSAGPLIVGWLSEEGIEHIESHLSDKTTTLLPPYDSAEARATIHESQAMRQRQCWIWDREETLRYFLAGGGEESQFDACWSAALTHEQELLDRVQRGELRATFAPVSILVSGRKKITLPKPESLQFSRPRHHTDSNT